MDLDPVVNSRSIVCDPTDLFNWSCVRCRYRNMGVVGKSKNHNGFCKINFFGHNSHLAISYHSSPDRMAHHTNKSPLQKAMVDTNFFAIGNTKLCWGLYTAIVCGKRWRSICNTESYLRSRANPNFVRILRKPYNFIFP